MHHRIDIVKFFTNTKYDTFFVAKVNGYKKTGVTRFWATPVFFAVRSDQRLEPLQLLQHVQTVDDLFV
jgi:hypothetical protein